MVSNICQNCGGLMEWTGEDALSFLYVGISDRREGDGCF